MRWTIFLLFYSSVNIVIHLMFEYTVEGYVLYDVNITKTMKGGIDLIKKLLTVSFTAAILLSSCSTGNDQANETKESQHTSHKSSAGDLPDGMQTTDKAKFKKGDKVTVNSDHMKGMKGAKGVVKAAYKTHVYEVTYKPKDGKKEVKNHKWVVNEEIENAKQHGFEKGDSVKLEADHMAGMKGAIAEIDNVKKTTAYVIDYKSTTDDKWIKNHKWMIGSELESR